MGSKTLRRSGGRGLAMITGLASFGFLVAMAGAAVAVSEEDIGASAKAPATSQPAASESPLSAPESTVSGTHDESRSLSGTSVHSRATFPYTVRPGDTLGSLATAFGITVADLSHANHMSEDSELSVGQMLRIPNPFMARERALIEEIEQTSSARQAAEQRASKSEEKAAALRGQVQELLALKDQTSRDLHALPWWRALAVSAAVAAFLMLGAMLLAAVEWWMLRSRFRAVAEMNESLRRLDYKYKALLAKAELRLQELYGRRRRGIQDGQERPKIAEEAEIELLNRQLKEILERHLERLKPPGATARRARWRELIGGVGSPVEARSLRR